MAGSRVGQATGDKGLIARGGAVGGASVVILGDATEPGLAGTRVVVAMSGGVDSSVSAALFAAAGWQVVGVTLRLHEAESWRHAGSDPSSVEDSGCCGGRDIDDARRVAARLGIRHYVLDYRSRFTAAVVENFITSYRRGETPNPCVQCNQHIKFGALLDAARELEAGFLVTGHYARVTPSPAAGIKRDNTSSAGAGPGAVPAVDLVDRDEAGRVALCRGHDPARDQSYFLFSIPAPRLSRLRFPVGGLSKAETRTLAARFGLPVAAKPDSQDICFVPDGDYAAMVARHAPETLTPGEIVDLDGRPLASHRGIIHYTVGQRRGLGIDRRTGSSQAPLYVVRLDAARNQVIVGPREALAHEEVFLRDVNWLGPGDRPPERPFPARVKLRSTQPAAPAIVTIETIGTGGLARLRFQTPQFGVAPGQAGVFYDPETGTQVLGGGWIVADCR